MDPHEFHARFAKKTYSHVRTEYMKSGLDPEKVTADSLYYCCYVGCGDPQTWVNTLKETENAGVHPDVTPEMVFKMIGEEAPIQLIRRYAQYERFDRVIELLFEKGKRYWEFQEPMFLIHDEHRYRSEVRSKTPLTFDEFVFIIDVIAENGYKNSIKYDVAVGQFLGETLNEHVAKYKNICLGLTKTCY